VTQEALPEPICVLLSNGESLIDRHSLNPVMFRLNLELIAVFAETASLLLIFKM